MAKRKASNKPSPMLVPVESSEAMVEATGTNDPELAQRLIGASRNTIKDHISTLRDKGHLTKHGAGRGTWYSL